MFTGRTVESIVARMTPRSRKRLDKCLSLVVVNERGCKVWPGSRTRGGYGRLHVFFGGPEKPESTKPCLSAYAHRLAWELEKGPIPQGMTIDHACLNTSCVNVQHLRVVTLSENCRDARTRDPKRTHCKRGHEFTAENTRRRQNGTRECVECKRLHARCRVRRSARAERFGEPRARRPLAEACSKGHPFTPENTYLKANGKGRACKTCQRMFFQRFKEKNRRESRCA